jgi:hypothetical protein
LFVVLFLTASLKKIGETSAPRVNSLMKISITTLAECRGAQEVQPLREQLTALHDLI